MAPLGRDGDWAPNRNDVGNPRAGLVRRELSLPIHGAVRHFGAAAIPGTAAARML